MEEQLRELIDTLKQLAPEVWRIYLKQAYITGWVDIGVGIFLLALLALCVWGIVYYAKRTREEKGKDVWHEPDYSIQLAGLWSAVTILLIAIFILLPSGTMMIANPEYYAIQALLGH